MLHIIVDEFEVEHILIHQQWIMVVVLDELMPVVLDDEVEVRFQNELQQRIINIHILEGMGEIDILVIYHEQWVAMVDDDEVEVIIT